VGAQDEAGVGQVNGIEEFIEGVEVGLGVEVSLAFVRGGPDRDKRRNLLPGRRVDSDGRSSGPYYGDYARRAREVTDTPLMLTGKGLDGSSAPHA
jgi:hypothetical protein